MSGGISYDNKFNVSTKVGGQVSLNPNPNHLTDAPDTRTRDARHLTVEGPRNERNRSLLRIIYSH
ncbi:hypothetical protein N9L76_08985 [bacterium]|nr:hypothetical protein [bacterium]